MITDMPENPMLAPSLLLSMPQLADPNFTRSVVLLCQHDADGAFGLVLNRPITTTARIVSQGEVDTATEQEVDVWIGGPVEPERSWILLRDNSLDDSAIRVCDGVYLSTSARVLEGMLATPDQSRARLIAGYAGWGPGQLDEEVAASAWLSGDIDLDIVFQTPADEMWERAIRRLGAEPGSLQLGSGVH
jgi:putative transcriptional regulator